MKTCSVQNKVVFLHILEMECVGTWHLSKPTVPLSRFVVKDRVTSYSSAQRSLIVMQILLRVKFDDTDKVCIRKTIPIGHIKNIIRTF